ncbi:unnamed protein product [Linum trigynum]|uniref:Uncharacterized protein n=1 Tax=Linum trigynum TaxID=586398 RepID=A0AAV2D8N3_9ROSI
MVFWTWVWKGFLIDLLEVAAYGGAFWLAREGYRRYSFPYGHLLNLIGVIFARATFHCLQRLKRKWQDGPRQPLPAAKDATAQPATKY